MRLSDDDVFVKGVSSHLHVKAVLKLVKDIIMENFKAPLASGGIIDANFLIRALSCHVG